MTLEVLRLVIECSLKNIQVNESNTNAKSLHHTAATRYSYLESYPPIGLRNIILRGAAISLSEIRIPIASEN